MSRLSPEAEQLVRAGRAELKPGDADRERVLQSLLERTGGLPEAGGPAGEPSRAPVVSKLTPANVSGALAGLAMVGAGVFWISSFEPSAAPVAALPATPPVSQPAAPPRPEIPALPVPSVSVEPPSPPDQSDETTASGQATRRAPSSRRSAERAEDHLSREVALLSRASSELHAARPAAALKALDEHARKFPSGVLSQERAAARARALCALGRTSEAQAELAKLTPGSPHAARAAKACASAAAREE